MSKMVDVFSLPEQLAIIIIKKRSFPRKDTETVAVSERSNNMEKLNVAIADDNERMLELLDEIISQDQELEIVGKAVNGEEAYQLIKSKHPDVVLLDIIMPKLDDLSVMDKINHDSELTKHPTFIVITAIGQEKITENAFVVPSLDKKSLQETGIQNCDVAVVCIGEELDVSILTSLNLVSMGIPRVIAKAASPEHGQILEKLGAEVVYPERDMALRLASRLETDRVLDIIQLSEKLNISKVQAPGSIVGKTVLDLNLRSRFGLNIIAIENDGKVNQAIRPDDRFQAGDILFLIGDKEGLMDFYQWAERI